MKAIILNDIISKGKNKKVVAKKGATVKIISDMKPAYIVEDSKKERFSVNGKDMLIL